jgi:diguanylate cyclase (GGDEF)-like protein
MVDIDFFKKYNDHYGHQQGDEALKQVANILQQHARRANDVLARYGGEEFILMHQPDSREHLKKTLNAILESINEAMIPHETSGVCNHITVSAGACLVDEPGGWMKDYKELAVKVADQALYKAKNKGRNTFHLSRLDPACNV